MLRKSLKINLTLYLLVNGLLVGVWAASGGGYFRPVWLILGWGIGVAGHAAPLLAGVGSGRPHHGEATVPEHGEATVPEGARTSVGDVASLVGLERPSLRPAAAPDGTVTMLFSDIESSTALTSASVTCAGSTYSALTTPSCAKRCRRMAGSR